MSDNARNMWMVFFCCAAFVLSIWIISYYSNQFNLAALKTQEVCIQNRGNWNNAGRCTFTSEQ